MDFRSTMKFRYPELQDDVEHDPDWQRFSSGLFDFQPLPCFQCIVAYRTGQINAFPAAHDACLPG